MKKKAPIAAPERMIMAPAPASHVEDEEEDLDERTALRYHDGFLEDDEPNEVGPKTEYKDEPESEPETFKDGEETVGTKDKGKGKGPSEGESGSGSSSSWQDAADEEARV